MHSILTYSYIWYIYLIIKNTVTVYVTVYVYYRTQLPVQYRQLLSHGYETVQETSFLFWYLHLLALGKNFSIDEILGQIASGIAKQLDFVSFETKIGSAWTLGGRIIAFRSDTQSNVFIKSGEDCCLIEQGQQSPAFYRVFTNINFQYLCYHVNPDRNHDQPKIPRNESNK